MRARLCLLPVVSAAVVFVAGAAEVIAKTVPITREHVAGEWVGMSSDNAYVYRLGLNVDGTGMGAFTFLEEEPCLFRIASWSYKKGFVSFDLQSPRSKCVDGRSFAAFLRGSTSLTLTMSGNDWRERCILQREAAFLPRWKRLVTLMRSTPGG